MLPLFQQESRLKSTSNGKAVISSSHTFSFSRAVGPSTVEGMQSGSDGNFLAACMSYVLRETWSSTRAEAKGWVSLIRPHYVFTMQGPRVCSHTHFQFTRDSQILTYGDVHIHVTCHRIRHTSGWYRSKPAGTHLCMARTHIPSYFEALGVHNERKVECTLGSPDVRGLRKPDS